MPWRGRRPGRRYSNIAANREQTTLFGQVAREYGALRYREFRGDDLGEAFKVGDGDLLTAAVVDFSRAPIATR